MRRHAGQYVRLAATRRLSPALVSVDVAIPPVAPPDVADVHAARVEAPSCVCHLLDELIGKWWLPPPATLLYPPHNPPRELWRESLWHRELGADQARLAGGAVAGGGGVSLQNGGVFP